LKNSQKVGWWSCGLLTRCSRGRSAEWPASSTKALSDSVTDRLRSTRSCVAARRRSSHWPPTKRGRSRYPFSTNDARCASVSTAAGRSKTFSRSIAFLPRILGGGRPAVRRPRSQEEVRQQQHQLREQHRQRQDRH